MSAALRLQAWCSRQRPVSANPKPDAGNPILRSFSKAQNNLEYCVKCPSGDVRKVCVNMNEFMFRLGSQELIAFGNILQSEI